MPMFLAALCSRIYRSPMLSNYLSWLEASGVGFILPLDKRKYIVQDAFNIKLVYVSQSKHDTNVFFDHLANNLTTLKAGDNFKDLHLICPTELRGEESIVKVSITKIFASKARPLLLELKYHESFEGLPDSKLIFKEGNCLPDLYTTVMIHIFNTIWKTIPIEDKYKPYIENYTVLPLGFYRNGKSLFGGIECVPSISLEDFAWSELESILDDNERAHQFLRSAVGAYCFGYCMVLRDRHKDNMMIKKDENGRPMAFLQIDFEFVLSVSPDLSYST